MWRKCTTSLILKMNQTQVRASIGAWVIIQQTLQLYSLNELLLHILHAVLINYHYLPKS